MTCLNWGYARYAALFLFGLLPLLLLIITRLKGGVV